MTSILYEHPLNERIRNYLKLEYLFAQVKSCSLDNIALNYNLFFSSLFTILDTLERNDVRGDLLKDLEKLEQNLVLWSKAPNVHTSALEKNLTQTVQLICQFKDRSTMTNPLKNDKFLTSVKQRFAIQGGNCSFDLPQLHFWLHQPQQTLNNDIQVWLGALAQLEQSLALVLKFIRQRGSFETINTDNAFYQASGEGVLLLRIKIAEHANYYPTISGNRFRYSIRFMLPCQDKGRRFSTEATQFQLACC